MVNAKHDTTSYENVGYKREISNLNVLYDAFQKVKKSSDWKPPVQKFEMNLLSELVKLKKELISRIYEPLPTNDFILRERGKIRPISGDHIRDRVVKRALCDEVLIPSIRKYLIYDNGASLKGKGTGFTRPRLDTHLKRYYKETGSNEGHIYLDDYTKFFDNIQHERLMDLFRAVVDDDLALYLVEKVLKQARVDVSYMSDLDFADSMNVAFSSMEHRKVDKSLLTGEKYLAKRVNIGDQVAQVAGIFYPYRVDNYIKIVEGVKYFGRYMDDTYIIHRDREYLVGLSERIEVKARENGIFINKKKTRICRLSDYWRFLQIQYSLTETGRIIKKINPQRLTAMRRKLKKLAMILDEREFTNYYNSWFKSHYKLMSKQQRENLDDLFYKLKEGYHVRNRAS